MAELHAGERKPAWFKPGAADDQDGPYEVAFKNQAGVSTAWAALIAGTHPAGGVGFYVWVSSGVLVDSDPDVVPLTPGRHMPNIRYVSGELIDVDPLEPLDVQ